jgi:hypothetical protein
MDIRQLSHSTLSLLRGACLICVVLFMTACSTGKMVVRGSQSIMDSGIEAMNRESDLQLARVAMPANLKLMEGMLLEDPDNLELLLYAAQGFYGYSYGFIETEDRARAGALYRRCYDYSKRALTLRGFDIDPETATPDGLRTAVAGAAKEDVPVLFWSASCLGKWVDMNRDSVSGIAGLSNVAILMQRVIELDETYQQGAAHLYLGVTNTLLPPAMGGKPEIGREHFEQAIRLSNGQDLTVKVLYARQYARLVFNRELYERLLQEVISADPIVPDLTLGNMLAQQQAKELLVKAHDYF